MLCIGENEHLLPAGVPLSGQEPGNPVKQLFLLRLSSRLRFRKLVRYRLAHHFIQEILHRHTFRPENLPHVRPCLLQELLFINVPVPHVTVADQNTGTAQLISQQNAAGNHSEVQPYLMGDLLQHLPVLFQIDQPAGQARTYLLIIPEEIQIQLFCRPVLLIGLNEPSDDFAQGGSFLIFLIIAVTPPEDNEENNEIENGTTGESGDNTTNGNNNETGNMDGTDNTNNEQPDTLPKTGSTVYLTGASIIAALAISYFTLKKDKKN